MAPNSVSFPHPVLGNRDDVEGELAILETSTFALQSEVVHVTLDIHLEQTGLKAKLASGESRWIVTVDCQRTVFRRGFIIDHSEGPDGQARLEFEIERGDIADKVTFVVEIIAASVLENYSSDGFHADYSGFGFRIDPAQILGQSAPAVIQVDQDWDPLNPPTSSFLRIDRAPTGLAQKLHVSFDSDEIIVTVNGALFDSIEQLPTMLREKFAISTVVMPALVYVLTQTSGTWPEGDNSRIELEKLRWFGGIRSKLESLQMSDADPIEQAYRILEAAPERLSQQISTVADQEF